MSEYEQGLAAIRGRLTEAQRVQIGSAGDHYPEVCDCSPYVVDSGYAPENCCDGLLDTLAVVESILRDHAERAWDEALAEVERRIDQRGVRKDSAERWGIQTALHIVHDIRAARQESADD